MKPLLEVDNLTVHFPAGRGLLTGRRQVVRAVDGISFSLAEGQTLGVVGESGCGKTTLGLAILKLIPLSSGRVSYQGQDLSALNDRQMRRFRREMQIIFQDPYSSLNPRMTVRRIISDPIKVHGTGNAREMRDRVDYLMEKVGLTPEQADRYPHEFSGGQRQRIGIARALSLGPRLIIADEPVSALDVSIQAQIINLLLDLHDEFGLSYIFISHDLAVVEYICDRVAVMYLGQIVETAPYGEIYTNPLHPYTQALLAAVPAFDPATPYEMSVPAGDVPNPIRPPPGCRFHPRCPVGMEDCRLTAPAMREVSPGHFVACLTFNSNNRKGER